MNSRERIIAAINHREADRIPFDLGSTFTSGIHVHAYHQLRKALNLPIPEKEYEFLCLDEQIVFVDEPFKKKLNIDTEAVLPGNPSNWMLHMEDRGDHLFFVNEWQMGLKKPKDGGLYYDVVEHPLASAGIEDLKRFDWPDPKDPARFLSLEEDVEKAAQTGRAVIMNNFCAGIIEISAWLVGYERLFSSLLLEQDFIEALFDRILGLKMAYWETVLQKVGDRIDVVVESDDLGEQRQLLMSPRIYRKLIKPRHKQLYDLIHAHTPARLFLHSCGAIYDLIPDLIEIGVDIINPVQINAPNMDSAKLKAEFGKDLVFWGGAVNPQATLNHGTPQQVRDETRRNIENLAPGGGFVFAAVHNIQPSIPTENILAMWETLQKYGLYSK